MAELRRKIREETRLKNIIFGKRNQDIKIIDSDIETGELKKYQDSAIITYYFYGQVHHHNLKIILSSEHQDCKWVKTLDDIKDLELKPKTLKILQKFL